MATIAISPRFFINERNNYSNWTLAFGRELKQNAVDAGATEIRITMGGNFGEQVTFEDNGCGMDRNTLEKVYFSLGETTKMTNETLGGFGKARIVTCFGQKSYAIHTQNWIVTGVGSEYVITHTNDYYKGCKVTVDVDVMDRWGCATNMIHAMNDFLKKCQIQGVKVYVNGELFTDWMHKRNASRQLSFGTVYVNRSGDSKNYIFARVSGV
jgi:hypothetical protein